MTSENNEQTISIKKARQHCDNIARQLNAHKSNYHIIFTITGAQSNEKAIVEKQSQILQLPHGQNLQNKLKRHLDANNAKSAVVGIITEEKKKMMGLLTQEHYTALVNLNTDSTEDHTILKTDIFGLIWQFISIIKDIESQNERLITKQNDVTSPKWNNLETARRQMLSDAFGASILQINELKTAIKHVAKHRAEESFEQLKSYDAKQYPFPAIMETTELVYQDLFHTRLAKESSFQTALNITEEIKHSIDENTALQWQTFIDPARDMAWAAVPVPQILGAAIYTSDNVYNRSLAQLISEILNSTPTPIIEFDGYNAFSDIDGQKRSHKLACFETFEFALKSGYADERASTFIDFAEQSCEMLLEAKPCGWCAPALFEVAKTLNTSADADKETLFNIFSNEINMMDWNIIRTLNKNLIERKSQDKECNLNSIIDILRQEEETRTAAITIKALQNLISIKKAASPSQPFIWEDIKD